MGSQQNHEQDEFCLNNDKNAKLTYFTTPLQITFHKSCTRIEQQMFSGRKAITISTLT